MMQTGPSRSKKMIKMKKIGIICVVLLIAVCSCLVSPVMACHTEQRPSPRQPTILFFKSDNRDSARMQPVITKLQHQGYLVTTYDVSKNPYYATMGRFQYSVTRTPTIVVLGKYEEKNIVGVHDYNSVLRTIKAIK